MSTITSSRASNIASPPSSSRSSLSIDRAAPSSAQRRNRTALRDYYNLKAGNDSTSQTSEASPHDQSSVSEADNNNNTTDSNDIDATSIPRNSELDKPDFSASNYVSSLLTSTSLEGILQVESSLISDIRGFDGERKALVYDNYSKLIAATETISRMRTEMDPLAPTVMERLEPAVEKIAGLAGEVSRGLVGKGGAVVGESENVDMDGGVGDAGAKVDREKKVNTVKWVLTAPQRFRNLVEDGRKGEAEAEWEDIQRLLGKWEGVKGVEKVREQSLQALNG